MNEEALNTLQLHRIAQNLLTPLKLKFPAKEKDVTEKMLTSGSHKPLCSAKQRYEAEGER